MKKKLSKKMEVSRETLLKLDNLSLELVAGGESTSCTATEPSCKGTRICTDC